MNHKAFIHFQIISLRMSISVSQNFLFVLSFALGEPGADLQIVIFRYH